MKNKKTDKILLRQFFNKKFQGFRPCIPYGDLANKNFTQLVKHLGPPVI